MLKSIVLVSLLGACGTSMQYVPLNAPPHPMTPRSPDSVEVFMGKQPDRQYVEVGTLESQQSSEFSTDDKAAIIGKMRADAAQRGCDGLLFVGTNDQTVVSGNNGNVNTATLAGYRATCIVYNGAPPPTGPMPAATPAAAPGAPPPNGGTY
jgi:hypothetical protein